MQVPSALNDPRLVGLLKAGAKTYAPLVSELILTDAQIKALPTGGGFLSIVQPPGPGLKIVFHRMVAELLCRGAYTNITGAGAGSWFVGYRSSSGSASQASSMLSNITGVASALSQFLAPGLSGGVAVTMVNFIPNQYWDGTTNFSLSPQTMGLGLGLGLSNIGLSLFVNNSGAYTGGDSRNQMSIRTYFTIEPALL